MFLTQQRSLAFPFREDCQPYSVIITPGKYNCEAWGASGGGVSGGRGAYITGILTISKTQTLYVYIGGKGADSTNTAIPSPGGCNGGGNGGIPYGTSMGGAGGGGSTDIRLGKNDTDSRILVAAGGGGSAGKGSIQEIPHAGGYGGEEEGGMAVGSSPLDVISIVANQTNGYQKINGEPGKNGIDLAGSKEGSGGAGGGYWGGFSSHNTNYGINGGGGGSSYVNPIHFPIYHMKNGNKTITTHFGTTTTGSNGNGFVLIIPIKKVSVRFMKIGRFSIYAFLSVIFS